MAEIRRVRVDFGDDSLWAGYHVERARRFLAKVGGAPEPTDPQRRLDDHKAFICTAVHAWDLQEDDGSPVPVNEATVVDLPPAFVVAVADAIVDDVRAQAARRRPQRRKRR